MNEDVARVRRQGQLRQKEKMEAMGRLAAGVAHDFNNILGIILGHCEILDLQLQSPNPAGKHVHAIENAAKRAAVLTRRLLAFSRDQIVRPKIVDLNTVIGDLRSMLSSLLCEGIQFLVEPAFDLGRVEVDESDITQVVMNMVVNARDAMPNGGVLIIRTANIDLDEVFVQQHVGSRAGSFVMLSVSDSGQGMTHETMAHIFEPFFTTKEVGKGTGLGLSTVYNAVKRNSGYISVRSKLGEGSTFEVYLPRIDLTMPREEARSTATEPFSCFSKAILLVEDDQQFRETICQLLKSSGYVVLEAATVHDAMIIANERRIDLVLTDLMIPGGGRYFIEWLKTSKPGTRVLYMSGYSATLIDSLGAAFVQKPFSKDCLLEQVEQLLTMT